ncbi:MAG: hypothetical protein C5B55_02855 [Blastocatellia bacterium]|nr:MAG: hypothetical protein C5B55_02855 [Blastocatellia bacterium]
MECANSVGALTKRTSIILCAAKLHNFGRLTQGQDVVNAIANSQTDRHYRLVSDVKWKVSLIECFGVRQLCWRFNKALTESAHSK